jgi:diguanylate cyclase (GGDEF)-like protein
MNDRLLKQLQLYEKQKHNLAAGSITAGIVLVYFTYPAIDHVIALGWLATHIILNIIRYLFTLKYHSSNKATDSQPNNLYIYYLTITILSGLLWGAAALLFYPIDSTIHGLYFVLVTVGILTGGLVIHTNLANAYPIFLTLVSSPLLIVLLRNDPVGNSKLVTALVLFSLFSIPIAQTYRKTLLQSIDLSIQLKHQARHDALTKIPNRRYFIEQLHTAWQSALRHKTPITVMILDIDYFKKINDTYGHNKGDECLQIIGQILKDTVKRSGDFVARIGGEEFAIVLTNDKTKSAIKISEILSNKISQQKIPTDSKKPITLTVSMGIACTIPNTELKQDDFINAADQALYDAKASGRNCYKLANLRCRV